MLKKAKQQQYFARREKQWQQELETFGASGDQESLHRLRVAVKKVKAFARLAAACGDKTLAKDSRRLKKMFRQAGVIRDAANHRRLLERFHPADPVYAEEQEQLQNSTAADFRGRIGRYRKQGKKATRRLVGDVRSIKSSCVRDWYAAQLIETAMLLTESGDLLHMARKKIKEMLYVAKLLPQRLAQEIALNREYLNVLQRAIGDWHDAVMVVSGLRDVPGKEEMIRECREREAAVRSLADTFDRQAHLD